MYFLGQLTEVTFPIDSLSKRNKGFAFITYMFPEHAVKAFNDLDGTDYKVRQLQLLIQFLFSLHAP